jgi:L-threonylcarbamoyladenylate synthase
MTGAPTNYATESHLVATAPRAPRVLAPDDLDVAVRAVEGGELIVAPTNRWYMVCCDAGAPEACARVYAAKRRPAEKSLLLVLPDVAAASHYFEIGDHAKRLINALWPGDLALRLRWKGRRLGDRYAAVGAEVALVANLRGVLGSLARRASVLLAATSANFSGDANAGGTPPAICLAEVLRFGAESPVEMAAVIDGGVCPEATHMTIVDCSMPESIPEIVRQGTVHPRAIAAALDQPADVAVGRWWEPEQRS